MSKPKSSAGCGFIFLALFALGGLALLIAAVRGYRRGEDPRAMLAMGGTGTAFFAAGLGFGLALRKTGTQQRETQRRRQQFPTEPWKWNSEWDESGIAADPTQGAAMMWLFAILWNAISVPAAIGATQKIAAGEKFLVFVYVFPLIGACIVGSAIYRTLQRRKFGRPIFVPASLPGEIGGTLGGVIQVPRRVEILEDARLSLRCMRRAESGSGNSRTVRETVWWENTVRIAREKWRTSDEGTEIPVLLPIAAGCRSTEITNDKDNRVLWRLVIHAKTAGVDFGTSFEVPVFVTGREQARAAPDGPMLEEYRADVIAEDDWAEVGIRREPDGFVFTAEHLRGLQLITGMTMFGMIALVVFLFVVHAPWILLVVAALFAAIAALFAYGVWPASTAVRFSGEAVVVSRRGLLRTKEIRVRRADVADIRSAESMGIGDRKFYQLKLIGVSGCDPEEGVSGEPFAARKLRFQLRQVMKELGTTEPENTGGRGREILEQLQRTPKFEIELAGNVPGLATAEAVSRRVLTAIRGS